MKLKRITGLRTRCLFDAEELLEIYKKDPDYYDAIIRRDNRRNDETRIITIWYKKLNN